MPITVSIYGVEEFNAFMNEMPDEIMQAYSDAVPEVSMLVLADQGGGQDFYPPETEHNSPPTPYYIRGTGEQMSATMNTYSSEQMGSQFGWYATGLEIHIQNTASYAESVIGDTQNDFFAVIGWRKLFDVAADNISDIVDIIEAAIQARIDARGGGPE